MPDFLPNYNKPPVVETVLSVQFDRLLKFRTAHAGCFWKTYLDKSWTKIEETAQIPDAFERFGDERKWGPMAGIRFSTGTEAMRTQISRSDDTRMIQIQDSRFIYNWKKGEPENYPSYDTTRPEFDESYEQFKKFVASFNLGTIVENQWEVSYINHLIKGDLWSSAEDCNSVFPWLHFPPSEYRPDFVLSHWAWMLPNDAGRLHVDLNFGRVSPTGPEAIILTLTARGKISPDSEFSLDSGFELGHAAIVKTFTAMTSGRAQDRWDRTA